jgi:hypothetical protein
VRVVSPTWTADNARASLEQKYAWSVTWLTDGRIDPSNICYDERLRLILKAKANLRLPWGADERHRRIHGHAVREEGDRKAVRVLDLNDYYPTSNLPRLYRLRGREGDERKAAVAATITAAAAQRSMSLGQDDIWVRPTLLGAAFDAGDATRLLLEIRTEGPARWQLESTLGDLEVSLSLQRDPAVKAELSGVLASLQQLTDGGTP